MENKLRTELRAEFEAIIRETDVPSDGDFWLALMQTVHTNQQKIIDGLSGVIESQKQTMEAMGKRLLMIENVIKYDSSSVSKAIYDILHPTAESAFKQPRFYTEADMLAMGKAVLDETAEAKVFDEPIYNINITQILKTINDGKQQ